MDQQEEKYKKKNEDVNNKKIHIKKDLKKMKELKSER